MKPKILFLTGIFIFLVLISITFAEPNPRLGEEISTFGEKGLNLELCYSAWALEQEDQSLKFVDYYNKYKNDELPEICTEYLEVAEMNFAEGDEATIALWYKPESNPIDNDDDLFTNLEEQNAGTDPNNPEDFPWWIDVDGDGYTNQAELLDNVDPFDVDQIPTGLIVNEEPVDSVINSGLSWQIYLAIALAVLLIIFLIIYAVYYGKYSEK
jgi:hypothetical protein